MKHWQVGVLAGGLLVCGNAFGQEIDQQNEATGVINGFILSTDQTVAQTFRPSYTGWMTGAQLELLRTTPNAGLVSLELRAVTSMDRGIVMFGPSLFSTTIPLAAIPQTFTYVDVPFAPTPLTAEQDYAMIMWSDQSPLNPINPVAWRISETDTYGRGTTVVRANGGDFITSPVDTGFRTVMSPVPEPAVWQLGRVGVAGAAFAVRRRGIFKGLKKRRRPTQASVAFGEPIFP
jgi:hypothetical protein